LRESSIALARIHRKHEHRARRLLDALSRQQRMDKAHPPDSHALRSAGPQGGQPRHREQVLTRVSD
ncbi:hypothetical protein, partial [Proteus mirabilis]|uniref:hypothetical protein n=1 Tax=Proteus mirabilis TaxID=584 RepID=UPI001954B603